MKMTLDGYFKKQGLNIMELNCSEDHIHILFEAVPQMNLSNFVNAYKTASSRMVRKNFENELKQYYWKPYFWSLSYFIGSVSENTLEAVKKYIQNQELQK